MDLPGFKGNWGLIREKSGDGVGSSYFIEGEKWKKVIWKPLEKLAQTTKDKLFTVEPSRYWRFVLTYI